MVGAHFSLSFIGYVLADDMAFRQLAWFGGVYALSACIVAVNVFAYRIWTGAMRAEKAAIVAGILLLLWYQTDILVRAAPEPENTVRIAAVATQVPPTLNLPPETYTGYLRSGAALYEDAAKQGADIIFFPEGSDFLVPKDAAGAPLSVRREDGSSPSLITSRSMRDGENLVSRMEYYDFTNATTSYTYKSLLIPVGEYLTGFLRFLGTLFGVQEAMHYIEANRNYVSGPAVSPQTVSGVRIGALFCNEVMSPSLYQRVTSEGAQILLNASSQDWFKKSRTVNMQLVRAAQVRAVENHRYYVQASNTSPAMIIDYYGRIVGEGSWDEEGVLVGDVGLSDTQTPFSRLGSTILLVPLVIIMAAIGYRERQRIRKL
jgi:apolipoprotein N-acyltransferase